MGPIQTFATFIFCLIMISDGERWYAATVVERKEKSNDTRINRFKNNAVEDQRFVPLIPEHHDQKEEMENWHFRRIKTANSNSGKFNVTDKIQPKPTQYLKYDNTINVTNKEHKKKIIRRTCPGVRKDRKLFSSQKTRTRFLEVFEVIEFDHVLCISSSGLEGLCLPESECESTGGKTMGTCADGYGTCCVTQLGCDEHSAAAVGWFTNPDFPSPSTRRLSCTLTLNKISEDIKQLRLDFMNFELLPPTGGTCQEDQFIVWGQNSNNIIPIICGINTGQHVYIEVGDIDGPINLSVQSISAEKRLFSIKITQLTATDELAVPSGCFQYYNGPRGYIESFNYHDKSVIGIARTPGYLNNLNYAICINRAPGKCSVTYRNADYSMQIINYDEDGLPVIPPGQAGVEIFNCPGDWLLISATRLCGERLNDGSVLQDFSVDAPVTDTSAGPIVVWFRTDEGYVGRGFRLRYQQNDCNGPT